MNSLSKVFTGRTETKGSACSRVTFVVDPSCHPLFFFKRIQLDFSVLTLRGFLSYPYGVVPRDAVIVLGALEESTLRGEISRETHIDLLQADKGKYPRARSDKNRGGTVQEC